MFLPQLFYLSSPDTLSAPPHCHVDSDLHRFPSFSRGCNALLAYLLTEIYGPNGHSIWQSAVHPLIYGLAEQWGSAAALVRATLSLLLLWLTLLFLYKHKAFLKA